MEPNVIKTAKRAAMLRSYLIVIFSVAFFYAVICTPANLIVNSNVLLLQTVLPLLVDVVMTFVNFLFYWISFAYLLYFMFAFGVGESKPFFLSYVAVVFARYALNLLSGYFVMGFPRFKNFLSNDFLFLLIDVAMDILLQMGIAILIVRKQRGNSPSFASHLPAVKLFDRTNPLLKSTLLVAMIPAAISLLSRLYYDIVVGIPQSTTDLLWMISYYLSDFLSVLIGYLVILLLLDWIRTKDQKWTLDEENEA